jgi:ABC-type uncharacterized transport system ATPase component
MGDTLDEHTIMMDPKTARAVINLDDQASRLAIDGETLDKIPGLHAITSKRFT